MGEYGEPWSVVEQGNTVKSKRVVTAHGASVASSLARSSGWAERIAACVNALDGVPDEAIAKVAALLNKIREVQAIESDVRKQPENNYVYSRYVIARNVVTDIALSLDLEVPR